MKKIILLSTSILALGLVSCKKDYKCTCSSTGSTTATVTKFVDVSKKAANANCVNKTTTSGGFISTESCTLAK